VRTFCSSFSFPPPPPQSRPFGVALLFGGVDKVGKDYKPALYHADPSGTFIRYSAKAIGSGSEGAQTALQEGYNKSMSFEEAEKLALQTLKQVMEEQISSTNVELAAVKVDKPYHLYSKEELQAILSRLPATTAST